MDVSVSLDGIDEVLKKFKLVDNETRYKSGRFALRRSANIVRDAMIEGAKRIDDPDTPEDISKNVAIRWGGRRFRRTGDLNFRVGLLGGARQQKQSGKEAPGGHTFYWRFIEFGTDKMPAQPFVRNALEDNIQKATDEFVKQYSRSLDRAIKRAKK